jgi:hypothetical protein
MKKNISKKKTSKTAALYILAAVLLMMVLILFSYKLISNGKRLSNKDMLTVLENFPYESIIDGKDKRALDLTSDQILYIGYLGLNKNQITTKNAAEDCVDKYDEISPRCEAKELGLSEEKSSDLDTNLWKNIINYSSYSMFSLDSLIAAQKEKLGIYGNYKDSFYKGLTLTECGVFPIVYDKNVDMFFSTEGLGCTIGTHHSTYVTNGYVNDDIYEIYLVEGTFNFNEKDDNGYFTLVSRSNPTKKLVDNINLDNLTNDYEKDLLKKYSDNLDHYKLIFKKVGDNYQFISIDYLG